jgi:hypothetical protein
MCSHPPAKHLKLDPVSQTGRSQFSAGHSSTSQAPFQPAQPTYVPVQQPQYPSYLASLKDCAAGGCSKKVHYDHELGPFDYCSPECRDRHLLPSEHGKLKKDIEDYSMKMATYYPPSSSSASAATDNSKKEIMPTIEKKPKEQLGIITAQIRGERGLRIVGVELDTPAHRELKSGKIKLLDIITQLNEEDIESGESFRQSTRDKTRPLLTLMRDHKTPSINSLLSKVKDKCKSATHIRVLINPNDHQIKCGTKDFGFQPGGKGLVGFILGVRDDDSSSAHLSGVTLRDEALMYAVMSRRQIGEGNIPSTTAEFQQDISKALNDGKHLILVLM